MNTLHIIFRTCTRVSSLNAHKFGTQRPFTSSKRELVLACLNSLLHSLGDRGIVHVIDDHSPTEDVGAIQKLLKSYGKEHTFTALSKTGNGHSIEAAFRYAKERNFKLIYFCEDDYLHLSHAIPSMLDFYEKKKAIIFPVDYIDRYDERELYPSHVYLGAFNYWRSIKHTTITFMADDRVFTKYWDVYMRLAEANKAERGSGAEDNTINAIYEKELCVSPIPSLAAHISPHPALPPFVDWKNVFEENKTEALRRIGGN